MNERFISQTSSGCRWESGLKGQLRSARLPLARQDIVPGEREEFPTPHRSGARSLRLDTKWQVHPEVIACGLDHQAFGAEVQDGGDIAVYERLGHGDLGVEDLQDAI